MRQRAHTIDDDKFDSCGYSRSGGHTQQSQIARPGLQAATDAENPH
jgi:hypothetical protein